MVDPVHSDDLETLSNVLDRVLLVDVAVHGDLVALRPGAGEHRGELGRGVVPLVGVQSDAGDPLTVRQGLHQGRHRVLGRIVAQKAHDQLGAQAQLLAGGNDRLPQPADDCVEADATRGMCLGIEEHFYVAHILVVHTSKVCPRQVVEVIGCHEHLHALVVADQERGQVVEAV